MAKLAYLEEPANLLGAAGVVITPTTEDTNYPKENAVDSQVAKVFKFTSDAAQNILFDLGSEKSATYFALVNHNLTNAATITLKAGATSSVTDFSQAVTWREFDAWVSFASQNHRYWRIDLDDPSNPDGIIQFGYALIGVGTQLSFTFRPDFKRIPRVQNLSHRSVFNVPNVSALSRNREFQLAFGPLTAAERQTLETLYWDTLRGELKGLFLIPDPDSGSPADAFYGRFTTGPEFEGVAAEQELMKSRAMTFIEDGRGEDIPA